MRLRFVIACFLLPAGVVPAAAEPAVQAPVQASRATPVTVKADPAAQASMKVVLVRSAAPGCEPACAEWIAAQGMIDANTLTQFKKVLKALGSKKVPILMDSGGGVVDDSLAIGRLIRAKGLDIVVSKTTLTSCGPGDPGCKTKEQGGVVSGVPVARLAKCASSCAFILAAGKRRFVGTGAFVGVHQVKTLRTTAQIQQKYRIERQLVWGVPTETRRTLISEKLVNQRTTEAKTPDSAYAKIAKYFEEMGVHEPIMPILKSTPNSSIHWLTRNELKTTAMATDLDGEGAFSAGAAPTREVNTTVEAFKTMGASGAALPPAPTPKH